jgi:hypothetical protein
MRPLEALMKQQLRDPLVSWSESEAAKQSGFDLKMAYSLPLSVLAMWAASATPGVTTTLCGARTPAYALEFARVMGSMEPAAPTPEQVVVEAPVFASAEDAAAALAADQATNEPEAEATIEPLHPLPDLPPDVVAKMYWGALEALKEVTPKSETPWWTSKLEPSSPRGGSE